MSNHIGSLLLSTFNTVILFDIGENQRNVKMMPFTEDRKGRSEVEIK